FMNGSGSFAVTLLFALIIVYLALAEHPKSGKAHYIAAEVYARAGDFTTARHELATAESLEPGLPFANARSVAQLRAQLSQGRTVRRVQYAPYGAPAATRRSSVPWGLILVGLSIVVIVWSIARRRRQMAGYSQYPGQGYPGQAYPGQPMGMPPGGVAPPMGGYPYGYGGGSGSGLMGSLGTGLAVGAGVAAGEALVGKMLGGGQGGIVPPANAGEIIEQPPQTNEDMGGADFGTSGDSWDDGSGGGGGGGADFGTGGDFGGGGDSWT
ncbi:MAG: hypothetical protein ACREUG_14980, partial [Steroidobacteraceae bacterium]